ncbi:MAG: helix-hairpin-helix domain-containing protein [FCB group bacterium]|nr:helix-hairpin-helix domain-containing protein [FCB group bacterium]MBL7029126.1 helix-hairpin-helix domain-containing protein [Candidatus Neomarinimicrobiota bacterium]MBL7122037.1 helix-hairpin-helix domain-containing protein [Candidatus Neomarinimicrobiota bacterium]
MLNFTRQERIVIYFLVVTLGVGAVLRLVRNQRLENQLTPNRFYEEEQQFKKIAEQINSDSLQFVDITISTSDSMAIVTSSEVSTGEVKLVNLNTAGVSELAKLPGIGPAKAKRIKAYTDQNGPFKNKSDIILVKGIGEKIYTRLEGLVTTE